MCVNCELADKAVKALTEWHGITDAEVAHSEADKIIIQLIRDLGYDRVADAWGKVEKWYA